MNSILKNPTHVAQISYNGFNMEQICDFTAAPAMLLPVYYDLLNPGDKVDCNAQVKLRTMPLETAAEFQATVRLDWFAVPIEQLFKYFGQLYYGIQDFGSDFINVGRIQSFTPSSNFPYFELSTYFNYVDACYKAAATGYTGTYPIEFTNSESSPFSGMSFERQICYLNDSLRLMDFLGYPISSYNKMVNNSFGSSFPVTALAYQKIFYDYYRVSDYQVNDPHSYNVDSHVNNSQNQIANTTLVSEIFRLHYIPWKKDFFKNVFSSPLQGSQSIGSLGTDVGLVNQWLSGLSKVNTGIPAGISFGTNAEGSLAVDNQIPTGVRLTSERNASNATNYRLDNVAGMINPANINAMFAVQKALEITRRSGKHYDAQTLAHWGVSVPDTLAGEVIYLGSQTQPLVVGDVISTSASGNEPLGTIGGKGYSGRGVPGSYSKPVKFEAKTHTVLMCVFSVQPDLRYFQEGIDKLNMLVSPADWLHPEYDNLGMQPLFDYQLRMDPTYYSNVFGWQYSYSELKCKYNRVLGDVGQQGTLKSWVPQVYYGSNTSGLVIYPVTNHAWFYYAQPNWLNDVITYGYYYNNLYSGVGQTSTLASNYYALLYERDPFICSAIFDVKKASKMSKYGLQTL